MGASRSVALAVIWRAAQDMRRQGTPHPSDWIEATVFLGSKSALIWFDAALLELTLTLDALGWVSYAQDLLDDTSMELLESQRAVLEKGIEKIRVE